MRAHVVISTLNKTRPVLISGATASGKSTLALKIAVELGGVIINADALQVYNGWRILTARPSAEEELQAQHLLYGHIDNNRNYSVGDWIRQITPILKSGRRPIIVGGTGLYFRALTEGLANIPPVPKEIQAQAKQFLHEGKCAFMLQKLDDLTKAKIDVQNPIRISRAWEVLQATGRSIVSWHDQTPPPLMPLSNCDALHLDSPVDWLNNRLKSRFDTMILNGALDEAKVNLDTWNPNLQASKAIGATELISYLLGQNSLADAKELAVTASRQYAKRQRTWFRKRMTSWRRLESKNL